MSGKDQSEAILLSNKSAASTKIKPNLQAQSKLFAAHIQFESLAKSELVGKSELPPLIGTNLSRSSFKKSELYGETEMIRSNGNQVKPIQPYSELPYTISLHKNPS